MITTTLDIVDTGRYTRIVMVIDSRNYEPFGTCETFAPCKSHRLSWIDSLGVAMHQRYVKDRNDDTPPPLLEVYTPLSSSELQVALSKFHTRNSYISILLVLRPLVAIGVNIHCDYAIVDNPGNDSTSSKVLQQLVGRFDRITSNHDSVLVELYYRSGTINVGGAIADRDSLMAQTIIKVTMALYDVFRTTGANRVINRCPYRIEAMILIMGDVHKVAKLTGLELLYRVAPTHGGLLPLYKHEDSGFTMDSEYSNAFKRVMTGVEDMVLPPQLKYVWKRMPVPTD